MNNFIKFFFIFSLILLLSSCKNSFLRSWGNGDTTSDSSTSGLTSKEIQAYKRYNERRDNEKLNRHSM